MGVSNKQQQHHHQLDPTDVDSVVISALGSQYEVVDYYLSPFSQLLSGLLASHHLLTVRVRPSPSNDENADSNITSNSGGSSNNIILSSNNRSPAVAIERDAISTHTYFVKTSYSFDALNQRKRKLYVSEEYSFPEEVHYFKEAYPRVSESFVGQLAMPKCLLAKDGLLVFEDLKAAGYAMTEANFLDLGQLRLVAAALAKFHASSLILESKLGRPLNLAFPGHFHEKHFSPASKLWQMSAVTISTTRQLADYFQLGAFDEGAVERRLQEVVKPELIPGRNVICHGDLWKNNVMFKGADRCILVDYQLLRYASLGIDLAQLMYLNCEPTLREKVEVDVLDHYYAAFKQTLKRNNCGADRLLTREEVREAYDEHKFIGAFYALVYLQGILLEPLEFKKVHKDIAALSKFLFETRMESMLAAFGNCGEYREVMKRLVVQFLEAV